MHTAVGEQAVRRRSKEVALASEWESFGREGADR